MKRHPTLFLMSASQPGLAHQPMSPWQQIYPPGRVVTYGQCCPCAGTCQVRAGCWVPEDLTCSGAYSDLHGTNRAGRKKRFSVCLSGMTNQSLRMDPVSDREELKRKAVRRAVLLVTHNIKLEDRKILVGF